MEKENKQAAIESNFVTCSSQKANQSIYSKRKEEEEEEEEEDKMMQGQKESTRSNVQLIESLLDLFSIVAREL